MKKTITLFLGLGLVWMSIPALFAQTQHVNRVSGFDLLKKQKAAHTDEDIRSGASMQKFHLLSAANKQKLDSVITDENELILLKYDQEGNLTGIEEYDKNVTSGLWEPYSKSDYVVNPGGLITEVTVYDWIVFGARWQPMDREVWEYDGSGNQTRLTSYEWDGIAWKAYDKDEYVFDANGNEIQYNDFDWDETAMNWNLWYQVNSTYNSKNQKTEEIVKQIPFTGTQLEFWEKTKNDYSNDLWIKSTGYNYDNSGMGQWNLSNMDSFTYTGENNTGKFSFFWDELQGQWFETYRVVYSYDSKNNLIESIESEYDPDDMTWNYTFKEQMTFNNDFSREDLVVPYVFYDWEHMLTSISGFFWDNNRWNSSYEVDFYYSAFSESSSVRNIPASEIRVFPHPIKDQLKVELKNGAAVNEISISDLNGKQVHHAFPSSENGISVKDLVPGMYIYEIRSSSGISRGKFIKQ